MLIPALGLFGLAAFSTEQRIKEIGIRQVLGATVLQLTTPLPKDFLKLVGIAIKKKPPLPGRNSKKGHILQCAPLA